HAERAAIGVESLNVLFRVIAYGDARGGGIGDDAVVHVGQVHHVGQLEAAEFQEAPQDVLENEGAEIADVRVVVHRGAAGVHADFPGLQGHERLNLAGQRVVDADFVHDASAKPFHSMANE